MIQNPKISVIMPVYNTEKYLQESLDCLFRQTMRDFEIICVDDGSTDRSPEILSESAQKDDRLVILRQNHQYAGAARNLGIQSARGKYLIFLDSDDRFKEEMLETLYTTAEAYEAEITVFRFEKFDNETGIVLPLPLTCDTTCYKQKVFSKEDDPDRIFSFTNTGPCNKLFLRKFIRDQKLTFPSFRSAEDLPFVMTALAEASRITTVDRVFMQYRVNNNTSLTGAQGRNPLTFYDALLELKTRLQERGLYRELERAYINLAAVITFFSLHASDSSATFQKIYHFVKSTVLNELDLSGREDGYIFVYPEMEFDERIRVVRDEDIFTYMIRFREVPRDLQMAAAESISGWDLLKLLRKRAEAKFNKRKTWF